MRTLANLALLILFGCSYASAAPSRDVICANNEAEDVAALNAALVAAKSVTYGGNIVLQGPNRCVLDSKVNLESTGYTNVAPITIDFETDACLVSGLHAGTTDVVQNIHLTSLGRGGTPGVAPAFGWGRATLYPCFERANFTMVEMDAATASSITHLNVLPAGAATVPTILIHSRDTASPKCPYVPCGSTQINISDNDIAGSGLAGSYPLALVHSNSGNASFDAKLQGNTYSSPSSTVAGLYLQNWGNVYTDGGTASWFLSNGGPFIQAVCNGTSCGGYRFSNIAGELDGGDCIIVSGIYDYPITVDNFSPSDGNCYLFKLTDAGAGARAVLDVHHITGSVSAYLDPATRSIFLGGGSDTDASMIGQIANPPCLNCFHWDPSFTRSGVSALVRFANRWSGAMSNLGGGAVTAPVPDPLGRMLGVRVTTTNPAANKGVIYLNYYTPDAPAVGDVLVGMIAVRTKDSLAGFLQNNLDWTGSGITDSGFSFVDPFPSGVPVTHEWKYLLTLKKVTAADGASHDIAWEIASRNPAATFDFAFPYWTVIRAAQGLPDQEILNWAASAIPFASKCAVGSICTP